MTSRPPTPQAISALLRKAGFDKSVIGRGQRHTDGFHVRGTDAGVYVGYRPETPLLTPSAAKAENSKAIALRWPASTPGHSGLRDGLPK